MKQLFFIAWMCVMSMLAKAGYVYEFNSTCQQAYLEITKLKLSNGQALINKAKQQNPDNLIPVALENYIDFYTLSLMKIPPGSSPIKKMLPQGSLF
jgi:hypothetical protein